ncbi:hypothetical protein [Chamaesiphon sp. OTE_20_metabat_361]|uniref:hypothetical protein n=1 Tax=Chamaesiphon sp. OTE_20_metabat_361 TaxID=2964689 RepID=UPI00286BE381|nr:hypothetical protein [Chamaesiphon sp. OTE_20_metabat_361]
MAHAITHTLLPLGAATPEDAQGCGNRGNTIDLGSGDFGGGKAVLRAVSVYCFNAGAFIFDGEN